MPNNVKTTMNVLELSKLNPSLLAVGYAITLLDLSFGYEKIFFAFNRPLLKEGGFASR